MSTQIRLLLYEQSNLGLYCLFERLLKHFSRRQKQMTFVVIDVLRVKHLPIIQISTLITVLDLVPNTTTVTVLDAGTYRTSLK